MSKELLVIIIVACFSCNHKNEEESKHVVDISIQKNAQELLKDDRVHSVSIGIYKNGEQYSGHFGELTIGQGDTPSDKTFYDIASVTKTMTGLVLANAVLEGRLSLDDDIREYMNDDYPNLEFNAVPIRIRDVITHTGGIPSNFPEIAQHYETDDKNDSTFFKVAEIKKKRTKEDFFDLMHTDFLTEEPGSSFVYSNVGPQLIAHILENVYDEPFEDLIQKYVFDKYEMIDAQLFNMNLNDKNYPKGYNENGIQMPHLPGNLWEAAGGVKLTMPAMLNYLSAHVERLDKAIIESHRENVIVDQFTSRAYFFWVENTEDGSAYMHNGYDSGTQNWFIVYPEYKLGISVITNTSFPSLNIWKIAMGLADDLKPFGTKSIGRAITSACKEDVNIGIALYHELKQNNFEVYDFSDPNELNTLGYDLMIEGDFQGAVEIFKLNIEEFPTDSNAYDSLGEAYYNIKNYPLALVNYKQSFELDSGNTNAQSLIKEIEAILHSN